MKNSVLLLYYLFVLSWAMTPTDLTAQCAGNKTDQVLSPRLANYNITADLNRKEHKAVCSQTITWKNSSPDTISELRFYMYMNAFKNRNTTYLNGVDNFFGEDITGRPTSEFGYITVTSIYHEDQDLSKNITYIQPNDGNKEDETVLSLQLTDPIMPGKSITLDMDFVSKLPKTFVRSGYGKNDFHLFVHWFPQLGVYEQNREGLWAWNCHQFMQKTEFYADFGNYEVTITTDEDFTVGASGCRVSETTSNGKKTSQFVANDIIDFGWTTYPHYEIYTDTWRDTDIELLIPPEHCGMAEKYIDVIKESITFLEDNVGPYYYPKITIVDPPVHSMRSGFMEYPMLITVASVYGTPDQFRGSQSLAIHEFTHMYFMGMLASNEKEEAWLDEGFVTFFEDEILDHLYGEKCSFYDFGLVRTGNAQKSRQEYTTIKYPEHEAIAKPGWENKGYYKELVYGKTATVLRTFKNIIGDEAFSELIKNYFDKNKFSHPREEDWLSAVDEVMSKLPHKTIDARIYWHEALHTSKFVDYSITNVDNTNRTITVSNLGAFDIVTDIKVKFADGSTKTIMWDGHASKTMHLDKNITEVHIDPDQKILLDLNMVNNSYTAKKENFAAVKYGGYSAVGGQILFHILSFFL